MSFYIEMGFYARAAVTFAVLYVGWFGFVRLVGGRKWK
jgi:hypothetical protein